MIHAYDEMYVDGAMICLGDMIEYAVLDLKMNPDSFFKLFIDSSIARKFEIGNVSVIAGRSGPELVKIILEETEFTSITVEPVWREDRSDLFWAGWTLAYFQWYSNLSFNEIWQQITIRKLLKLYPTLHEADLMKSVDELQEMMKYTFIKVKVSDLRKIRGWSQTQLARYAGMSVSQLQRIEYGERNVENLSLRTALALSKALGVDVRVLK